MADVICQQCNQPSRTAICASCNTSEVAMLKKRLTACGKKIDELEGEVRRLTEEVAQAQASAGGRIE